MAKIWPTCITRASVAAWLYHAPSSLDWHASACELVGIMADQLLKIYSPCNQMLCVCMCECV